MHRHCVQTQDGQELALWYQEPKASKVGDILLIHGTFSDRSIFLGLKDYLAEQGYGGWLLEWRGHGESALANEKYDMEVVGREDIKGAMDYLGEKGIGPLHCITHSGGGIALTIFLIENPQAHEIVRSITMFACQSFGANTGLKNYMSILAGKYISKVLGYTPAKLAASNHKNETYHMMQQWFDWNLSGRFLSRRGKDYRAFMPSLRIPIFSLCAQGDRFIAPPSGCRLFLDAFQNESNTFLVCGQETGFNEDFNHSRVILSRNAEKEIWPLVLDWINANAE